MYSIPFHLNFFSIFLFEKPTNDFYVLGNSNSVQNHS